MAGLGPAFSGTPQPGPTLRVGYSSVYGRDGGGSVPYCHTHSGGGGFFGVAMEAEGAQWSL